MSKVGGGDFGTVLGHYIVVMFKFECRNIILHFFGILNCSFCSIMLFYLIVVVTYRESMPV